jgi:hypothetical protein
MLFIAICLTVGIIAERLIYSFLCVLEAMVVRKKRTQAIVFLQNMLQFSISCVASCCSSFGSLFRITIRTVLWILFFLVVWGALYFVSRKSSSLFNVFEVTYNSDLSGSVRMIILFPLRLVTLLVEKLIPVWNFGVYCLISIPPRVILENIVLNLRYLEQAVIYLYKFVEAFVISFVNYVNIIYDPPDSFDASQRLLDLITPMGYVRITIQYVTQWIAKMCLIITIPLDMITYPLMDVNFGRFIHWFINTWLYLLIQVPMITVDRCAAGGGAVVYCLPDFEPVWQMLVESIRSLGSLVDNWLDVVLLILQATLTGTSVQCNGWFTTTFNDNWGTNQTIVLGINTNEYVKTDGWSAEIHTRTSSSKLSGVFSMPVRVDYGIAHVTTSTSDALFGCVCRDGIYGMEVTCSVAPLDARSSPYLIPVEFRIPTTSFYMGCTRSKIRVESIRWPVNRHTDTMPGSPVIAQAAIWIRPFCTSDADHITLACVETFALASCSPYCMALYTKGMDSGSGTLVLRSASEWRSTVYMVDRDCGLFNWDVIGGELKSLTDTLLSNSGVIDPRLHVQVETGSDQCVYSANTVSRLLRNISSSYVSFQSVDLSGQPFGFAGDLVFTAVQTSPTVWGVRVERLYGSQVLINLIHLCFT